MDRPSSRRPEHVQSEPRAPAPVPQPVEASPDEAAQADALAARGLSIAVVIWIVGFVVLIFYELIATIWRG